MGSLSQIPSIKGVAYRIPRLEYAILSRHLEPRLTAHGASYFVLASEMSMARPL